MNRVWPVLALVGLGLFHGANPAMGWLFAVALGMQRGARRAVLAALGPIAIGHALSILAVIALVELAWTEVDLHTLQLGAACLLISLGLYRLWRGHRHRLRVGMSARPRDLMFWSFLMATGHGAGLMLVPVLLYGSLVLCGAAPGAHGLSVHPGSLGFALGAVAVHTAAMIAAAGGIAIIVFEWAGLGTLRKNWINLDIVWCVALVATGVIVLVADAAHFGS